LSIRRGSGAGKKGKKKSKPLRTGGISAKIYLQQLGIRKKERHLLIEVRLIWNIDRRTRERLSKPTLTQRPHS